MSQLSSLLKSQTAYDRIPSDESEPAQRSPASTKTQISLAITYGILLIVLCPTCFFAGFFAGYTTGSSSDPLSIIDPTSYLEPEGTQYQKWTYNRTFSSPPSEDTDRAWEDLFPAGVGFIQHPDLSPAPEVAGVTVFHQLHCLNSLRMAHYAHGSERSEKEDINDHADPHHVRHCFDYLRHGIMCAADTNLEPVDEKLGGSTGWSSTRTCRDYESVRRWAERWRAKPAEAEM